MILTVRIGDRIMIVPNMFISPFQKCARCGRDVPFDEGGIPALEGHPFYNKFICDDCFDEMEEEKKNANEG